MITRELLRALKAPQGTRQDEWQSQGPGTMDIYCIGPPLGPGGMMAAARILRDNHFIEADEPLRHRRVPNLVPLATLAGHTSLRRYVPLLRQHLKRIGIAPLTGKRVAMVLMWNSPLNGVLALALRQASGLAPYIIAPARKVGESLRVIDPGSLLDMLSSPGQGDSPQAC